MASAVVFAYHNVGVRGLEALLRHGVAVPLVVTHEDDPRETVWFASVAELARRHGLPVMTPPDPNAADAVARVAALRPDFLFSFYYRQMLGPALLAIPPRGAFNLHGSLLPKYRGRAPVNWAVLKGETRTGATLHVMTAAPDAGPIVDQEAVPILPDETAQDVFHKVTDAGARVLERALPALLDGTARPIPQDASRASYFGRRTAADGRIDWSRPAAEIHNLVRAVTRPYPGAFTDGPAGRVVIWRTRRLDRRAPGAPGLFADGEHILARGGDGALLGVTDAQLDGGRLEARQLREGGLLLPLRQA